MTEEEKKEYQKQYRAINSEKLKKYNARHQPLVGWMERVIWFLRDSI